MRVPARLSAICLAGGLVLAQAAPAAQAARAATAAHTAPAAQAVQRAAAAPAARPRPAAQAAPATTAAAHFPGGVHAKGAAVMDAGTGKLLWSRTLNTERPMGSITKVMTALVVIRAKDLTRRVKVPAAVVPYVRKYDASSAGLHPGDWLTTRELLEALMLPSGCDAAYALATAYGATRKAFVAKMNTEAAALHLTHTHFSNYDGLPWPTETAAYSTPADLMALGRAAMKYPVFRSIVDQRSYQLAASPRHHSYSWKNTNLLLRQYPGTLGIKTGNTRAAGYCLLFEAQQGKIQLIGVVLHSSTTSTTAFSDATKILNWGFRHD
jgi:D-alanyl-D-alanine carboxypeptidase (penicillin-binding protein 5/6)